MTQLDHIQAEYQQLRANGLDPKAALARLRPEIVGLDAEMREKLLSQLRLWESRTGANLDSRPAAPAANVPPIKPLQTMQMSKVATDTAVPPSSAPAAEKVTCPHCGKPNLPDDVLCYSCGQLMFPERAAFETRHLDDSMVELGSDEAFTQDAILVLMMKDTRTAFKLRPQEQKHELVIGRSAGGAMKPDLDLGPHNGDALGVSRLHLSVSYDEKHHTVRISDMGSANGTFINGQRLHPEEVRVLRHGDELRLGKLVLVAYFYRPKPANGQ